MRYVIWDTLVANGHAISAALGVLARWGYRGVASGSGRSWAEGRADGRGAEGIKFLSAKFEAQEVWVAGAFVVRRRLMNNGNKAANYYARLDFVDEGRDPSRLLDREPPHFDVLRCRTPTAGT